MAIDDKKFANHLLRWFDHHGRKNLPWQHDISAYRVWVSEIMLQQTQVGTVITYFERFMQRFPNIDALAGASEDEVLHLWTGLGYYARARNLHKTAKLLSEETKGVFPTTVNALCELPGIGRSTAGAIVSIAHGKRAPILDGNVKRVLARCYGVPGWPSKSSVANELWALAERLTPDARVADYTQAIMDLGATLCTSASPNCEACPFEDQCMAQRENRIDEFPGKKPRKVMPVKTVCMLVIENAHAELLLERRPSSGLWGGLWSFPECANSDLTEMLSNFPKAATHETWPMFRHTFTHFHLDITPVHVKLQADTDYVIREANKKCWFPLDKSIEIGITKPVTKLIQQITSNH